MLDPEVGRRGSPVQRRSSDFGLWITALTAVLVFAGFRPQRFAGGAFGYDRPPVRRSDRRAADARAAGEHDRGRHADAPSEIPARGWKDIILRVYRNIGSDRIVALAAGVTFYSILALFPAIAALVAVYGLFADSTTIAGHLEGLSGILPAGALQVRGDAMKRIA